jgi:hypothetical protein
MYLEETEARNDCAGEGQYQSKRPTDRLDGKTDQCPSLWLLWDSDPLLEAWEADESLLETNVATRIEDVEEAVRVTVNCEVCKLLQRL